MNDAWRELNGVCKVNQACTMVGYQLCLMAWGQAMKALWVTEKTY